MWVSPKGGLYFSALVRPQVPRTSFSAIPAACGLGVLDTCHALGAREYKSRILKAKDLSTIVTGRSMNGAVRCLKTPLSQEFARRERAGATPEELGKFGAGSLRKAAKDSNCEESSFHGRRGCRHGLRGADG